MQRMDVFFCDETIATVAINGEVHLATVLAGRSTSPPLAQIDTKDISHETTKQKQTTNVGVLSSKQNCDHFVPGISFASVFPPPLHFFFLLVNLFLQPLVPSPRRWRRRLPKALLGSLVLVLRDGGSYYVAHALGHQTHAAEEHGPPDHLLRASCACGIGDKRNGNEGDDLFKYEF